MPIDPRLEQTLQLIRDRRAGKQAVKINFSAIPEEFHEPLIKELSQGYGASLEQVIRDKKSSQGFAKVNFDKMPTPEEHDQQGKFQDMMGKAKEMIGKISSQVVQPMAQGMAAGTNVQAQAMQQQGNIPGKMVGAISSGIVKASEAAGKVVEQAPGGIPKAPAAFLKGLNPAYQVPEEKEPTNLGEGLVAGLAEGVGSVPAFMISEGISGMALAKNFALAMAKSTPLANAIVKQTLAGSLFEGIQQLQEKGGKVAAEPAKTAGTMAETGLLFGGFGVLGELAVKPLRAAAGNPVRTQAATDAVITETERLRMGPATHVNPNQYGAGEKAVPNVSISDELNRIKSLVEQGIIKPAKLAKIESPELSVSYPQSYYLQYKDLIDTAIEKKADIRDLVYNAEKSQYSVKFIPKASYEQAGEELGDIGHAFNEQLISRLEPGSKVLKAGSSAKDSSPEIADLIIRDLYERELPSAISGKTTAELMKKIQAVREDPKAWLDAVTEHAALYGYDAINLGEAGIKVLNGNALNAHLGGAARAKVRSVIPEMIPDDALDMMPMIRDTIKDTPSAAAIKSKVWQLKKTNPDIPPADLAEKVKLWANKLAASDPTKLLDLDIARVGKDLIASKKDIGMIQSNFVDMTHVLDQADPSGTLLRKIAYPLKRAETDSAFWAAKVKDGFNKQVGNIEAGSKESAMLQKIGEFKEWAAAKEAKIQRLVKEKKLTEAAEAKREFTLEKAEIIKATTPERQKILHQARRTYDYLIDDVLNPIRQGLGKQPIKKREDYFLHFQELSLMDEIFGGLAEIPDEFAVERYFIRENEPFFSAELKRRGMTWKEDAVGGFHRYIEGISKVIFLSEHAARINASIQYLPPQLRAFVDNTVKYAIGKPPAASPGAFDATFKAIADSPVGKLLKTGQKNIISNSIVANWGTALAQLNTIPLLVGQTSLKDVLWAMTDVYGPQAHLKRGAARSLSPGVASHTFSTFDLEHSSVNSFKHIANLPVEAADNEMSQLAFWAGIHQAKRLGKRGGDIIQHADKVASFVNATYTRSSTPTFLRSDAIKFMMPLQRQMLNGSATLAQTLGKGPWKDRMAAAAAIEASGVGMNMALSGMASFLGLEEHREIFQPTDFIPFYNYFAYGGQVMVLKTLGQLYGGAKDTAQGKEKGPWKLTKAGAMLTLPYGGRQIINMVEGRPLGREIKEPPR